MIGRFFEDVVNSRYFIRLGGALGFENNRGVKFTESGPKHGVVILDLGCAIEGLERLLLISGGERDFAEALVGLDVLRIERNSSIDVINGLIRAAKIFCIDKCEL